MFVSQTLPMTPRTGHFAVLCPTTLRGLRLLFGGVCWCLSSKEKDQYHDYRLYCR